MKTRILAASIATALLSAAHAQVTTGLTGLYKLDEASGSTLVNSGSTGTGQNGSFQGVVTDPGTDPTRVTGFIGTGALNFPNDTDVASLGAGTALFGTVDDLAVSTSLWFNANALVAASQRLDVFQTGAGGTNFGIDINSTGVLGGRYRTSGNSLSTLNGVTALSTATWYHAMFTHVAGSTGLYSLYLNGILESTITSSLDSFGTLSNIGAFDNTGAGGPTGFFDGRIDDVGTWTRAVTGQQVAAIHAMGRFEGLSLDASGIDNLLTAFGGTSSTTINSNLWQYTTGLVGVQGNTGGTANVNAFVVLDGSGNGMKIVPEPGSALLALSGGAALLGLLRRRR